MMLIEAAGGGPTEMERVGPEMERVGPEVGRVGPEVKRVGPEMERMGPEVGRVGWRWRGWVERGGGGMSCGFAWTFRLGFLWDEEESAK